VRRLEDFEAEELHGARLRGDEGELGAEPERGERRRTPRRRAHRARHRSGGRRRGKPFRRRGMLSGVRGAARAADGGVDDKAEQQAHRDRDQHLARWDTPQ